MRTAAAVPLQLLLQAQGEDAYNLELMRLIDGQYTKRPFFGIRRMTDHLRRQHLVHHKRVERLWRSVKYEEVYLKDYQQVRDAVQGLGDYFRFYNIERGHQSLDYRTSRAVYHGLEWGLVPRARRARTPHHHWQQSTLKSSDFCLGIGVYFSLNQSDEFHNRPP